MLSSFRLFNFACSTIASICSTLNKLHKKGVVLRLWNADSLKFRFSESDQVYKFSKVECFDLAIVLQKYK